MAKMAATNPHAEKAMLFPAPVNCSTPEAAPVESPETCAGANASEAGSEDDGDAAARTPAASPADAGDGDAAAGSAATAAALLPPYHGPHPFLLMLMPKFLFYSRYRVSNWRSNTMIDWEKSFPYNVGDVINVNVGVLVNVGLLSVSGILNVRDVDVMFVRIARA